MEKSMLKQKDLLRMFHYDPLSGIVMWKVRNTHSPIKVGDRAGHKHKDGYRYISIACTQYKEHRLIFLYMEGSFPVNEVDHKNRIRDDNCWGNLRHATCQENAHNRCTNRKEVGVSPDRNSGSKKWRGQYKGWRSPRYLLRFTASYARYVYEQSLCR